jgi:hypothetical protein
MVGIIINDSIVLVTTVDEYAEKRGIVPAIIDGAADRLRPVLLTTLTTVLGLTPLLYETSQQAQFLKPTVITLVYGLGFGLVLVLLVVPALLAAQQDIAGQIASVRRVWRAGRRARGAAIAVAVAGGASLLAFAGTLGAILVIGRLPGPVANLLPESAQGSAAAAFALFIVSVAVIVLCVWIAAGLFQRRHRMAG